MFQYVEIIVKAGERMFTRGGHDQALFCQIHAVGVFSPEKNPTYFPKIIQVLASLTNLDQKR